MNRKRIICILLILSFIFSGCSTKEEENITYRDATPHIYEPVASQEMVLGNEKVTIDISNTSQGYVMVNYTGDNPKVKIRITNPNEGDPYTYDKHEGYETFPLTGGNGTYQIQVYENVSDTKYTTLYSSTFDVTLENEFLPYLYPSQYVNYNADSDVVALGVELASTATSDLDVVSHVYEYLTQNIKYDDDKADQVKDGDLKGYVPNINEILEKKTGICFDYAALMATMLRTQDIPTRLQIGYALTKDNNNQGIYHAWVSVYLDEIGWVDGLIQFDGHSWKMMDPTFAAESNSTSTRDFISNENNYQTKYNY